MDPLTVAKLWLLIKPIKRIKERRKAKRALDEVSEDFNSTDEVSMDYKAFAVQAVLAALRHLMTASPFAALATDDWLLQTATVLVGVGGFLWSLKRKVK